MASPFAKYQSEQVQQLAPGFVEAYGRAGASIGQGIANLGQGIATGIEEREKVKKDEAKTQAFIGSYLKRDPRIQGVNKHLAEGDLLKDDDGNVYMPPDRGELFDIPKLEEALAYYNKTGGDGSKLTGDALTKFATEFEADKKYEADEAAKAAAALERRKLLADISKTEAEAAEKYARAGIGGIIGAFGAGADMSKWRSPMMAPPMTMGGGEAAPQPPATAGFSILTGMPGKVAGGGSGTTPGTSTAPNTVTPARNAAGKPLATTLSTAPTTPAVATTTAPISVTPPASVPAAAAAPMPVNTTTTATSQAYLTEIPKLQQQRITLDQAWQKEIGMFTANHQIALARLTAQGATPDDIKALGETANTQYKLKVDRYNANIATLDSRLAGFQKAADEARAAEKAEQGRVADSRAGAGEKRATTEFEVKYGKEGKPATPGEFKTFASKIETKINAAGTIEGRTGGTAAAEMRRAAQSEHTQIMEQHPAWYAVGMTTEGANQYQFRMVDFPTAPPLSSTVRADAQTVVEGYAEGRVFLTNLLKAVESTDEDRVRNFLDRFLVTTSKDDVFAEGEQLGQFGVAAFRRAIVSGGNFSDADREYVQKLITQINSPNAFKDKDYQLAQTKKLASFIDAKFRSTLAAKGVRLDLKTSEAFLKREDIDGSNAPALESLEDAKKYYEAFDINTAKADKPTRPNALLDAAYIDGEIKAAEKANNPTYVKILKQMKKEHIEAKEKAAKKAAEEARRARGA